MSTATKRKELRSKRLAEAARRAIRTGDTEAAASRYQLAQSTLIKFMKSDDSFDEMRSAQVERTALKVQRAAAKKGEIALLLAASIERAIKDMATFPEADEKEKMSKAVGVLLDKYLAVLGDPSFIIAAQIGTPEGGMPGNEHTAFLQRLAERRGVRLPGMGEIEQPIEDAEIVPADDDEDEDEGIEPDDEWDSIDVS